MTQVPLQVNLHARMILQALVALQTNIQSALLHHGHCLQAPDTAERFIIHLMGSKM